MKERDETKVSDSSFPGLNSHEINLAVNVDTHSVSTSCLIGWLSTTSAPSSCWAVTDSFNAPALVTMGIVLSSVGLSPQL